MRRRAAWLGVTLLALLAGIRPSAQERPSLELILERAAAYIIQFVDRFSNVVAEEEYVQTWRNQRRLLNSEFLLVTQKEGGDYLAFRDVFKVNGNAVRDRDERIAKLFLSTSGDATERADMINNEGARHTFGGVFNNPVVALGFLQAHYQVRFKFTLGRMDKSTSRPGNEVWIVNYREQVEPTILRGANDSDLPASGSFWIESETGRVVRTELQVPNDSVVSFFRYDERFEIAVPIKMTDRYRYQNNTVTGSATYGRFRRFTIDTEENVQGENAR